MSGIFQTPELALGIAVGGAAGAAFEPKLEVPKQKAWNANAVRLPDLGLIAALLAGGKITPEDAHNMGNRLGFDNGTVNSVTWLAQNRLDFALMLRLWRRFPDYVTPNGVPIAELVDETLAHEQLDWNYHELLTKLRHAELIGLGDIATAIVRGAVPAPSWVPVAPPATTDNVPRFPVTDIDPVELAKKLGFDEDMLRIMTARSGLSLAPILATQALFRGKLTHNDWLLAIAEGDLRTEWAETLREAARQILTAGEYAELQLRGYYDRDTRLTHTRKHGMSDDDSDLLYDVQGRGLSLHAAFVAERRGGVFEGDTSAIPDWAMFQLQRGNLRPEVYNLAWNGRHTYPSAFVIRALLTGGALSADDGYDTFLKIGWPKGLARQVADFYGKASTTPADPHVTKAENQLWTTLHRSYVAAETDDATATATLPLAGAAAGAVAGVLERWQAERELIRKQLTPAQIKKAYANAAVNAATDLPWTRDEALAALIERGYATEQASSYLNI